MEAQNRYTIVIADDSPLYRKLLQGALSRESYCTFVAKDGREALRLIAEHKPAVLITDWEMPDITGIELCSRLRSMGETYTYSILLTAKDDKDQIIAGLASGADDYLTKPFHTGELLARVGVGIRMSELHREISKKNRLLQELAQTDALTGLPNRRALEDWASREIAAAQRHKFTFWIVMADLDRFKAVNDTYGHEAGDFALTRFASIIRSHTRSSDICARLGGEEFVLGISHIDRNGLGIAIQKLQNAIRADSFDWKGNALRVTASFGVAGLGEANKNLEDLLRAADSALYVAKNMGRDCARFSDELENRVALAR
jgi:two-component system, cell cycle response regulator